LVPKRGLVNLSIKSVDNVCKVFRVSAIDLHQHLWPEALFGALARRTAPPRIVRRGGDWTLELAGEAPSSVSPAAHPPARSAPRPRLIAIAPSSPLGIESLPTEEAQPLLDAFHDGILELGDPFRLWAAPALAAPGAGALEIDALLDRGAIGACVPAAALAGQVRLVRLSALLDRLEARDAPLFVHPGPAAPHGRAAAGEPSWWPALTDYVAEMQAAWLAWAQWGRPAHPRLKVVFAMLAGGAPLHAERLEARGGPAEAVHDELTFFDVSSYGPRTVDAMVRVVGVDRLVYGSDAPVIEPVSLEALGESVMRALTETNPARLLSLDPVPA
jgi:6-methylsalicylate decarboxylase